MAHTGSRWRGSVAVFALVALTTVLALMPGASHAARPVTLNDNGASHDATVTETGPSSADAGSSGWFARKLSTIVPFIINGQPVPPGQKLYMASLRKTWNGKHFCGGALIAPRFVLTAAHCLEMGDMKPEIHLDRQMRSQANEANSQVDVHQTLKTHMHPEWNGDLRLGFDIAILEMDRASDLPTLKVPDLPVNVNSLGVMEIIGWGLTEAGSLADNLMAADTQKFDSGKCNSLDLYGPWIIPSMICAGGEGRDSCVGDSGGPLVLPGSSDSVVGVTSFGKTGGCGQEGVPTVYTLINPYLGWIRQITGLTVSSPTPSIPSSNNNWWLPGVLDSIAHGGSAPSSSPPPSSSTGSTWWAPSSPSLNFPSTSTSSNWWAPASGGSCDSSFDPKGSSCTHCNKYPASSVATCLECCCSGGSSFSQWSYTGCPGATSNAGSAAAPSSYNGNSNKNYWAPVSTSPSWSGWNYRKRQ